MLGEAIKASCLEAEGVSEMAFLTVSKDYFSGCSAKMTFKAENIDCVDTECV